MDQMQWAIWIVVRGIETFFLVMCVRAVVVSAMEARKLYGWRRILYGLGSFLFLSGVFNFLIWFIINIEIGGDATNGKITDGHFYLGSHGRYTEVAEWVFNYSYAHTRFSWIALPVGFVVGNLLIWISDNRKKEPPRG